MKNTLDGINSKLHISGDKISDPFMDHSLVLAKGLA